MSLRRLIHFIPRHSSSSIPNALQSIPKPHLTIGTTTTTTITTTTTNRSLSTATKTAEKNPPKDNKKSKKPNDRPTTLAEYEHLKSLAKKRRTELYETKIANRGRHQRDRNLKRRDYFKNKFRAWYNPYKWHQEYLDREARRSGLPWRHRVAVLIERLPIVTADKEKWEEEYVMLRSELDRWGVVYPKELGYEDPIDQTVMTKEELYELLPEGFTPMPRETAADQSGFLQTLDRKLKTRVYLSVRPNDNDGWMLPTMDLREVGSGAEKDETIVECAKRVVKDYCGGDFKVKYIGNAPMGVYMSTNEELGVEDSDFFGVKTFYLRIQYHEGQVDEKKLNKNVEDWGWLDRDEVAERVKEEKGEKIGNFFHYLL